MSLRYLRHKPPFKHEPINEPGLFDIREYDADDVEIAQEDGLPFESVKPTREYQLWVSATFEMDGTPVGVLACSEYKNGAVDDFTTPAYYHWDQAWITQRLVARLKE